MKIPHLLRTQLILPGLSTLLVSTGAIAEEFVCTHELGRVTVDNLRVPPNVICNLDGTRVEGTIKVEANATLNAQRISVIGNIQAENARQVSVRDRSRIGGSVQLKSGGGATISDSIIDSDLQYDSNSGQFQALWNDIGGNIEIFQNDGSIEIVRNVIDGNLQCKENTQIPFGGGNIVKGTKEDQCAQLLAYVSPAEPCAKSSATFGNGQLHIPRVSVAGHADVIDYRATLRYAPELSRNGSLVFELTDTGANLSQCD